MESVGSHASAVDPSRHSQSCFGKSEADTPISQNAQTLFWLDEGSADKWTLKSKPENPT